MSRQEKLIDEAKILANGKSGTYGEHSRNLLRSYIQHSKAYPGPKYSRLKNKRGKNYSVGRLLELRMVILHLKDNISHEDIGKRTKVPGELVSKKIVKFSSWVKKKSEQDKEQARIAALSPEAKMLYLVSERIRGDINHVYKFTELLTSFAPDLRHPDNIGRVYQIGREITGVLGRMRAFIDVKPKGFDIPMSEQRRLDDIVDRSSKALWSGYLKQMEADKNSFSKFIHTKSEELNKRLYDLVNREAAVKKREDELNELKGRLSAKEERLLEMEKEVTNSMSIKKAYEFEAQTIRDMELESLKATVKALNAAVSKLTDGKEIKETKNE